MSNAEKNANETVKSSHEIVKIGRRSYALETTEIGGLVVVQLRTKYGLIFTARDLPAASREFAISMARTYATEHARRA
jgi:hypothetical protein